MDAFWCILLSFFVIRYAIKEAVANKVEKEEAVERYREETGDSFKAIDEVTKEEIYQRDKEKQKQRDIDELRKQGYDDELIAVILPTLNNGQ